VRYLAGDLAVDHDQDPVAELHQLVEVRRDHQHCGSGLDQVVDLPVDLHLRADVDTDRRLVEDVQVRATGQPPADHDLLLVAAGELADLLLRPGGRDVQPVQQAAHLPALLTPVHPSRR
jgi:hypothetical protein